MKINFDTKLLDLEGQPIKKSETEMLTLGHVIGVSLNNGLADDQKNPGIGEIKYKRGKIILNTHKGGEYDLKPEEISDIKKCVGFNYGPTIVAQCYDILNG